jgi:hypothetical protein
MMRMMRVERKAVLAAATIVVLVLVISLISPATSYAGTAGGEGAGAGAGATGPTVPSVAGLSAGLFAGLLAGPLVRLTGRAAALPEGARSAGPLERSTVLSGEVALRPADPAALSAFATAVSDPASPSYQHYLAPGEFGPEFGASETTIAATSRWLSERGLGRAVVDSDHLSVSFRATASRIEAAFGIGLERYTVRGGHARFAPSSEPLVPSGLAPEVEGVLGLSDVGVPQPLFVRGPAHREQLALSAGQGTPKIGAGTISAGKISSGKISSGIGPAISGPTACSAATTAATGTGSYTANQIASAYSMPAVYAQGRLGAGSSVAVFELEPFSPSDIQAYQSCYGTHAQVSVTSVDGGPGAGAGTGESALDIEQIIGLAPEASVHVYQGPYFMSATEGDVLDVYQRIADDDTSPVVSTSWGICEAELGTGFATAESTVFQQMAVQGQSLFASSGDDGSEDCFVAQDYEDTSLAVDDPGSQVWVTSAGGTSLTSVGPPPTETVWNNCEGGSGDSCANQGEPNGAGGGGVSSLWSIPSWQTGPGVISADSSKSSCAANDGHDGDYCREVPDVSASADPAFGYVIYWADGWVPYVGGTSASAPLWAAVTGLADQGCLVAGASFEHSHVVGFANPELYSLGSSGTPPFIDVTSGNNDFTDTNGGLYPATAHYDMATGLGTPIVSELVPDLQPSAGCPSVTGVSPSSGRTAGGTVVAISGFDLAGVTSVHFGHNPATALSYHPGSGGSGVVDATAPASASRGDVDVTVTTASGTSAADVFDKFDYVGPSVSAVVPPAGSPDGGEQVLIEGGGFTGATAVDFGSTAAKSFTVVTDSEIKAISPEGRIGTVVDVTVTAPIGTSPRFSPDHFTFTFDPLVTGVSPSSGTVRGGTTVTLTGANMGGAERVEFGEIAAHFRVVGAESILATAPASLHGAQVVDVTVVNAHGASAHSGSAVYRYVVPPSGYWLAAADGGIFSYGAAGFHGSLGNRHLNKPIVAIAALANDDGYRLVASDGGVFCFGGASYEGSMGGRHLNAPIVGMAGTPDGGGYWLVASDGGIFSFGDATFHGSMGGRHLNAPIVGMASSPDGGGYMLVASDGGIFSFGDARFHGSMGGRHLNDPVVGMAGTADGGGYLLVASDGGIFAFSAVYSGSAGAIRLVAKVVGAATT